MQLKAESNHVPVVHTLRGIAATAVCLFHFVSTTINLFSEDIQQVFYYGKFGVQMFFVISGFVIPLSMLREEYKPEYAVQFLKKRFVRLEPTYIVSILLALAYVNLRNLVPGSNPVDLTPSMANVMLHFGYLIPFFEEQHWLNNVYWTLAIEFQYYILICLIFPLFVVSNKIVQVITCLLLAMGGFLVSNSQFIPVHLPCFMFGISYALYRYGKIDKMQFAIILAGSSALIWINQGPVILFVSAVTLFIIACLPSLRSRVTDLFGNISYSLYLIHSIVGAALLNFLSHRVTGLLQKSAAVLLAFAVSTIAAYVLYLVIEKPSHEFSKKIRIRREKVNLKITNS